MFVFKLQPDISTAAEVERQLKNGTSVKIKCRGSRF